MKNKKFRRIERAIFIAYFKLKNLPSAGMIAKKARISRSTLYRHHATVREIPRDYEDYLIKKYHRSARHILAREGTSLRTIVHCMLLFIFMNRKVILELLRIDNDNVVKRLIKPLKAKVIAEWGYEDGVDKIFNIYASEVLGLILRWSMTGFAEKKIEKVLDDIMFLTRTARQRLGPIRG